jgi:hypothetical protein
LRDNTGRCGRININKNIMGAIMDRYRIISLVRLIIMLVGMSATLQACVSAGNSTSDHVDAKLREHEI